MPSWGTTGLRFTSLDYAELSKRLGKSSGMASNFSFRMLTGKVYSAGRDLLTGIKRLYWSNRAAASSSPEHLPMKAALSHLFLRLVLAAVYFFASLAAGCLR